MTAHDPPSPRWRRAAVRTLAFLGLSGFAFRLHERIKTLRLAQAGADAFRASAPDGLPLPPAALMVLVGGDTSVEAFLRGGAAVVEAIDQMLRHAGTELGACRSILDFGCGCGRVLRHLRTHAAHAELHGTDYNRRLVRWCAHHLPFAAFDVNELLPPLRYSDGRFDLVYAFSIFTHFPEALQKPWLTELARVLKPGGHLFLTVHGESFRDALDAEERARFAADALVVRHARMAGSNMCTAFHPLAYLLRVAAPHFELAGHAPACLGQDAVLLRRSQASV